MSKYANCIMNPSELPTWQPTDESRCVTPLINSDTCGSEAMATGLWRLYPGQKSAPDIHPNADELYYVVAGRGRVVMEHEEYEVRQGMTVFIPANVTHQSFNIGDDELVYYYVFSPPPGGLSHPDGWVAKSS